MTARASTYVLVGGLALALCGCGGASTASHTSGGGISTAGASASAAGWKATDACAVLDKATVAATLGSAVESAKLDAVKAEGNGFPLYSQCVYMLADGRMLVFATGQYTNSMNFDEQVADLRKQAAFVAPHPVDVPGLGKAAFWAKELSVVYTFLGDGRYMSATVGQPNFRAKQPTAEEVQTADVAVLRKAGA